VNLRRRDSGLSVTEILIIIVCIIVVLGVGVLMREQAKRRQCMSNLRQLGTAANMYLCKWGGGSSFPEPALAFRGDCWLAVLYWQGVVSDTQVFVCPYTDDTGDLPPAPPLDFADHAEIADDAISYAGRCKGLVGRYARRNTSHDLTCSKVSSASVMACDKPGNHGKGLHVVYADSHVQFIPGGGRFVGDGPAGSVLTEPDGTRVPVPDRGLLFMDSGEE